MIETLHYPATNMDTNMVLGTALRERWAMKGSALRAPSFSRSKVVPNN